MFISSVAKLLEVLKSRDGVTPVLFLTLDYPVSDNEFLEKTMDDESIIVFDLTEETIDLIQVTKVPQIRFYHKEIIRKKLIGGDIFKWRIELLHTEELLKKEKEIQNERTSIQQAKQPVAANREENPVISGPVRPSVAVDEKGLVGQPL